MQLLKERSRLIPEAAKLLCTQVRGVARPGMSFSQTGRCVGRRTDSVVVLPHTAILLTAHLKENTMLETIAIILIVLWLLGMVSSYTIGGFIHILLVIAVIVVLMRLIGGRRGR